jgi:hypothetical protein
MALKETINNLNEMATAITKDLAKVSRGNKTAAQRVRVGTIRWERIAKLFRKESIDEENVDKLKKKRRFFPKKRRRIKALAEETEIDQ